MAGTLGDSQRVVGGAGQDVMGGKAGWR
jgi:hypothetical protein